MRKSDNAMYLIIALNGINSRLNYNLVRHIRLSSQHNKKEAYDIFF